MIERPTGPNTRTTQTNEQCITLKEWGYIMENELEMMRKQFAILNEIVENSEDLLSTEQE